MKRLTSKLTYANLTASLALFLALGGISYAAVKLPKNSIHTKQLANSSVTSPKVKDGSLGRADLAPGVIPDAPNLSRFYEKGEADGRFYNKGEADARFSSKGETDSRFYSKGESDSRFLGKSATAADSNALGSLPADAYVTGVRDNDFGTEGKVSSLGFGRRSIGGGSGPITVLDVGLLGQIVASCSDPAQPSVYYENTQGNAQDVWTQNMVSGSIKYGSVAAGGKSGSVSGSATVEGAARFDFIVGNGPSAGEGIVASFDVTLATAPGGVSDNSCLVQVQSQSIAG